MSGYASLTASFAIATDRRLRIPFISTMFKSVSPRAFEDPKDRDASDPRLKRARLLSARFSVVKRCFAFAGRKLESVRVSISTGKTGGLVPRTRRLIGGGPDLAQAFYESFFSTAVKGPDFSRFPDFFGVRSGKRPGERPAERRDHRIRNKFKGRAGPVCSVPGRRAAGSRHPRPSRWTTYRAD